MNKLNEVNVAKVVGTTTNKEAVEMNKAVMVERAREAYVRKVEMNKNKVEGIDSMSALTLQKELRVIDEVASRNGRISVAVDGKYQVGVSLSAAQLKEMILSGDFSRFGEGIKRINRIQIEGDALEVIVHLTREELSIRTASQLADSKALIMKKHLSGFIRKISIKETEIEVDGVMVANGVEAIVSHVRLEENRLLRNGDFLDLRTETIFSGNSAVICDNFTSQIMNVEVSDGVALEALKEMYVIQDGADIKILYRKGAGTREIFAALYGFEESEKESRDFSEKAKNMIFNANGTMKDGVTKYGTFAYTPSGLRSSQVLLADITEGFDLAKKILNCLSLDWFKLVEDKDFDYATFVKMLSRPGQGLAPSTRFGTMDSLAIYRGAFGGKSDKYDGMLMMNLKSVQRMLSEKGISVSDKALLGHLMQNRPTQAKACGPVVGEEFMSLFVESMKDKVVKFKFSEIGSELSEAIYSGAEFEGKLVIISEDGESELPDVLMDKNALKSSYDMSIKPDLDILAWAGNSGARLSTQMLEKPMSINPIKTSVIAWNLFEYDMMKSLDSEVLVRESRIPSLDSFAGKPYVEGVLRSCAAKYCTTKDRGVFKSGVEDFARGIVGKVDKIKADVDGANLTLVSDVAQFHNIEGTEPLLKFGEVMAPDAERYFKNINKKLTNKIAFFESLIEDKELLISEIEAEGDKASKEDINKLKRIKKELKRNVQYVAMLNEQLNSAQTGAANKVALFKYPSIHVKEYYVANVVTKKEMLNRIKIASAKLSITAGEEIANMWAEAMKNFYNSLSVGSVVVPTVELLKNMLAGMDFDFDGATVVYDQQLVEILDAEQPVVVEIDTKEKEVAEAAAKASRRAVKGLDLSEVPVGINRKFRMSIEDVSEAAINMLENAGLSIGEITNINTSVIGMSIMLQAPEVYGVSDKVDAVLEALSFGKYGANDYVGIPSRKDKELGIEVIRVSEVIANNVFSEIEYCAPTKENLLRFLKDLNAIMRMYQEMTIDSVKTNETVKVNKKVLALRKAMKDSVLSRVSKKTSVVNFADSKFDIEMMPSRSDNLFSSPMDKLRQSMKQTAVSVISEMFERNQFIMFDSNMAHTIDMMNPENFSGMTTKERLSLRMSLDSVRRAYVTATSLFIKALGDAEGDEDVEAVAKEHRKVTAEFFGDTFRRLTADMTPAQRGNLAMYVSMYNSKDDKIDRTKTNSFGRFSVGEEYILSVLENGWADIELAGNRINTSEKLNEGDLLFFEYGKNKNCNLEGSTFTGLLKVATVNGRYYGVVASRDIIAVPEAGDKLVLRADKVSKETIEKIGNAVELSVDDKFNIIADGENVCKARVDGARLFELVKNIKFNIYSIDVDDNGYAVIYAKDVVKTDNEDGGRFETEALSVSESEELFESLLVGSDSFELVDEDGGEELAFEMSFSTEQQ